MTIPGGAARGEDEGTPAKEAAPPAQAASGAVLRDPLPWAEQRQIVQTIEETGYRAIFVPEIAAREAFSTLAAFSSATGRVWLGTGVVTVGSRSPEIAAMAAGTVHELSGGRMVLGIGAGAIPQGATPGPLERVRRYVRILRRVLSGGAAEPDELFGTGRFSLALPLPDPPPIWLGALGDRMIRLVGEVADGVLLNWCTPERVADARRLVEVGAERAGRDPARVTVAVYVRACLGTEEDVAKAALAAAAGQYATFPSYRRQFEGMGWGREAALAADAFRSGRPAAVPRRFADALTVSGGRDRAMSRFAEYREAGADLVLWYPVPARDPYSSILGTLLAASPDPTIER